MIKRLGLLLVFSLITMGGCQSVPDSFSPMPPKVDGQDVVQVPVLDVVDGDTIKVQFQDQVVKIRFLLIDTPETHHPKLGIQPFGPEASSETHRLLDHQNVILEFAQNRGKDKYGRYLAYVFTQKQSVEIDLLEKGLARVAYVIPPNTKYLKEYQLAEAGAKKAHRGVWKTPGYAKQDGFHPEVLGN